MALSSRATRPSSYGLRGVWLFILVLTVMAGVAGATTHGHGDTRVGVLYNSSSSLQHKLYLATWLGFRDTLPEEAKPHLIDIRSRSPQEVAGWIVSNQTTRIVSLLEPEELLAVMDGYKRLILDRIETQWIQRPKYGHGFKVSLRIILPRTCIDVHNYIVPGIGSLFQIECLQMDGDGRGAAMALLHRASRVGITNLIPVTLQGSEAAHEQDVQQLYRIYKEMVYMNLAPIKMERLVSGDRELQGIIKTHTGNSTSLGILVLDKNPGEWTQILKTIGSQAHVQIFTPWGPEGLAEAIASTSPQYPSHLVYTVMYAGAGNRITWSQKPRKRLLAELAEVMGHDPAVVTGVLAYDAATLAANPTGQRKGARLLLSGDYNPQPLSIVSATRARTDGTFYGMSPSPTPTQNSPSKFPVRALAILQRSNYILDDVLSITRMRTPTGNQFEVTDYEVPTATVFSSRDLDNLAGTADSKINCRPKSHGIRVTGWDPFTLVASKYEFGHGHDERPVPEYLLIPNQNGYGMELSCEHHNGEDEDDSNMDPEERLITSFSIACTPHGHGDRATSTGVNCYRSGFSHRVTKRAAAAVLPPAPAPSGWVYYGAPFAENRDGDANMSMAYYPGGSPMGMDMAMTAMSSTSTSKEPPTTTTEEPTTTTTPAPAPPPPPLPDLRMILRAAKPFIGGCIGTALGCAVCAIWLSRSVPILGVQPAICAGPCFTGTFGQCGGLLGRVGSETTVICTELFRQGRIDAVTFLADAEFGRRMKAEAPIVLKGYRILAEPLVEAMRASEGVTDVVAVFARPWAKYMRRIVEEETSSWYDLGAWIHWIGFPLCGFVGQLATWVEFVSPCCSFDQFYLLVPFLACVVTFLWMSRKKMLEA